MVPTKSIIINLIISGFHLKSSEKISPNASIINVYKYDQLGGLVRYSILICAKMPTNAIIDRLLIHSNKENSTPIGIGEESSSKIHWFNERLFLDKLGTSMDTGLVLNPNLPVIMDQLGHNKTPDAIEGRADSLLEYYSKECLQYLLNAPGRRYGIDRSFESVPDGIVLNYNDIAILFDSKAYKSGYFFNSGDMHKFEGYVNSFKRKYGSISNVVNSFVVISGDFTDSNASLQSRSNDLLSKCQTPICTVKAKDLGAIVKKVLKNNQYRNSIDWKRLLTNIELKPNDVEKELKRIEKDKIK